MMGGEDAFALLRRCAWDRDRLAGTASPGRPVPCAGMPHRPYPVAAPARTACQRASQTMRGIAKATRSARLPARVSVITMNGSARGQGRRVWHRPRCGYHAHQCRGRAGKRRDCLLVNRLPGGLRRSGSGQPGGEVSSEGGQVRAGPRRERLADPQVELVLVQTSLHERGLERPDHLLTVGMRRPQMTPARRFQFVSRPLSPSPPPPGQRSLRGSIAR
jgi:hypothetical protein